MLKSFVFFIITVLFSLIVNNFTVQAATENHILQWTNANHLHNRLDLRSGKFQQEYKPSQWSEGKRVELIGVDLSDFPAEYNIHAHKVKFGYLFNVPGTGLVFSLDSSNKQFKRLDNTFFRGFNFHSSSYVKHDTLFSIGGEGFWNTNSTLIYFDKNQREWEKVYTINQGPISLEWNFGGFCQNNNTFYSLIGYQQYQDNAFNKKSFYALDLNTRKWKELGNINTEYFTDQIAEAKFWLGDFFIYLDGDKPDVYILDPVQNRILIYEGKKNQLRLGSNELTRDGDTIYLYRKESTGVSIDSISVKELFRDSKVVGKLYIEKIEFPWLFIISSALLISFLVAVLLYLQMRRYKRRYLLFEKSERIQDLPEQLLNVLRYFQVNGKETMIPTIQMNDLLCIKSNSFETTRQQRSRDLKAINEYFQVHHNISDAIQRKNSEADKRQLVYKIDEKALKILARLDL
jgi:hypothetical protein